MINFSIKYPKNKRSAIEMAVYTKGARYRIATGVSVPVNQWNKRTQRAKQSGDNIEQLALVNEELNKIEAAANRTIAKFKSDWEAPDRETFKQAWALEYRGVPVAKAPTIPPLTDYMADYIERYRATKSSNTTRAITTVRNKLLEYEQIAAHRIQFKEVDMLLYAKLSTHFAQSRYRESYFATIIKVIKQVFREARDVDKIHDYDGIDAKGFTSSAPSVDNIYLSEWELRKLYNLRLDLDFLAARYPDSRGSDLKRKLESLVKARAFFLVGAYTGLRVSDFTRLGSADISDRIRIKTLKTDAYVVIPIHPIVREILDSDLDITSAPSPQKLNDAVKELANLAGITAEVKITRRIGGRAIVETKHKWELVTNHTARRSFATNAYKAGVPTLAIMKITGHTKESTFMKYIKITAEENAETLENHPFFK